MPLTRRCFQMTGAGNHVAIENPCQCGVLASTCVYHSPVATGSDSSSVGVLERRRGVKALSLVRATFRVVVVQFAYSAASDLALVLARRPLGRDLRARLMTTRNRGVRSFSFFTVQRKSYLDQSCERRVGWLHWQGQAGHEEPRRAGVASRKTVRVDGARCCIS